MHLRLRSSAVSPKSPSHHVHIANLSPTACPSASSPPLKHPQPQPPHIRTSHLLLSEARTLPSKHVNSYDLYNPLNTGRRTSTTDDNSRSPVRQGFRATPRTPSNSKPDNSLMDVVISSLSRPGSPRIKSSLGGVIVGSKRVPVVARQNAAKKQGQQACLHATALLQTLAPGSNTPQKDDSATQFLDETELPLEEQAAAATQTANEALTMFSKWAEREKLHISTVRSGFVLGTPKQLTGASLASLRNYNRSVVKQKSFNWKRTIWNSRRSLFKSWFQTFRLQNSGCLENTNRRLGC